MKNHILLSINLLFATFISAQDLNTRNTIYECEYAVEYVDPIDIGSTYSKTIGKLFINDSKSIFFCLANKSNVSNIKNDESDLFSKLNIKTDSLLKVNINTKENSIIFKDILFSKNGDYFNDTLFPMKWELSDEMKEINNLKCLKAKTFFRGRTYIAWYSLDLVFPYGPWKLGGLPGLIIESYDTKNQIIFKLNKIISIKDNKLDNFLNNQYNIQSSKDLSDYIKKGKIFIDNLRAQLSNQSSENCLTCQTETKIVFNNIENIFY